MSEKTLDPLVDEPPAPADRARAGTGLFRAFWRWHFYASILVVPIMLMLSVTGLIYLFRWQIDPAMHRGVITIDVPATGAPLPLSTQEAAVKAAYPGQAITAVQQGAEDRSTFSLSAETVAAAAASPFSVRTTRQRSLMT